jgi:hypothetical protein
MFLVCNLLQKTFLLNLFHLLRWHQLLILVATLMLLPSLSTTILTSIVINASQPASPPARQSAHQSHNDSVTAMYIDQQRRQQRANNIVIS